MVYVLLLGISQVTPTARRVILVVFYVYAWQCNEALTMLNIVPGILLADLHISLGPSATTCLPRPFAALMILLGLLLSSFPESNASWKQWSHILDDAIRPLLPPGGEVPRFMSSLGAVFLCLGIFFSSNARRVFSHPVLNWLGALSFPIYLLHNTLIKTLLCMFIYGQSILSGSRSDEDDGEHSELKRGSWLAFLVGMPVFFAALLWCSWLWARYVDPLVGKATKSAINWLTGRSGREEKIVSGLPSVAI